MLCPELLCLILLYCCVEIIQLVSLSMWIGSDSSESRLLWFPQWGLGCFCINTYQPGVPTVRTFFIHLILGNNPVQPAQCWTSCSLFQTPRDIFHIPMTFPLVLLLHLHTQEVSLHPKQSNFSLLQHLRWRFQGSVFSPCKKNSSSAASETQLHPDVCSIFLFVSSNTSHFYCMSHMDSLCVCCGCGTVEAVGVSLTRGEWPLQVHEYRAGPESPLLLSTIRSAITGLLLHPSQKLMASMSNSSEVFFWNSLQAVQPAARLPQ